MLGLVKSCIGTKFTSQFGDLIAVSACLNKVLHVGLSSCLKVYEYNDSSSR